MPRNDPTDNGGLFIGRRPGTAPLRYRVAATAAPTRRRADATLAGAILAVEGALLVTLWGPQPAAWLWVGGHVFHSTGSPVAGIMAALLGLLFTALLTIRVAMDLDRAWKLVRRAGGYEQKSGALERIFVLSIVIAAAVFFAWFLIVHGPASLSPLVPGPNAN